MTIVSGLVSGYPIYLEYDYRIRLGFREPYLPEYDFGNRFGIRVPQVPVLNTLLYFCIFGILY